MEAVKQSGGSSGLKVDHGGGGEEGQGVGDGPMRAFSGATAERRLSQNFYFSVDDPLWGTVGMR